MGLLRVAVLGSPEVFHDGSRLTFALRKAQALLLYLAVEGGMHPRSKLATFLWPDSGPEEGRTALRTALVPLRRLLVDPNASASQHSNLQSSRYLLGLNPGAPGRGAADHALSGDGRPGGTQSRPGGAPQELYHPPDHGGEPPPIRARRPAAGAVCRFPPTRRALSAGQGWAAASGAGGGRGGHWQNAAGQRVCGLEQSAGGRGVAWACL